MVRTRWFPRCSHQIWAVCHRLSSSPPNTTRCAMRASATRIASKPRGYRWSCTATTGWCTGSSRWPGSSTVAGARFVVGIFASRSIEDIAKVATGPLWLQLYWLRRRDVLAELAGRAEAAGYGALVLTVDTPRLGKRVRDLRNGFAIDPAVSAANLDAEVMALTRDTPPGQSAIAAHALANFDQSVTWSDLAWLRSLTRLPILVKG